MKNNKMAGMGKFLLIITLNKIDLNCQTKRYRLDDWNSPHCRGIYRLTVRGKTLKANKHSGTQT
jgi:hypothetical protein